MTFVGLVLVCLASTPPSDCSADTAMDLIQKPVANELECPRIMDAQAQFSTSAFSAISRGEAYVMSVCQRVRT
jgi:hypothetical protein